MPRSRKSLKQSSIQSLPSEILIAILTFIGLNNKTYLMCQMTTRSWKPTLAKYFGLFHFVIQSRDLIDIQRFSSLRIMTIMDWDVFSLETIETFTNLRTLNICRLHSWDKNTTRQISFPFLTHLSIASKHLDVVFSCPNLIHLKLSCENMIHFLIKDMTHLETLDLVGSYPESFPPPSSLQSLRILKVSDSRHLRKLYPLPCVSELFVEFCHLFLDFDHAKLPALRCLDIELLACDDRNFDFEDLTLTKLTSLTIRNSHLDNIAKLSLFTYLQHIDIQSFDFSEKTLLNHSLMPPPNLKTGVIRNPRNVLWRL